MHVKKRQAGVLTLLQTIGVSCSADFEIRYVIRTDRIIAYREGYLNFLFQTLDGSLPAGLPGVGVASTPGGNGIDRTDIYAIDATPPSAPVLGPVTTFHNKVELQWVGGVDTGVGLMVYQIFRRPNASSPWQFKGGASSAPNFVDTDVTPSTYYEYWGAAIDYHGNWSGSQVISVVTPGPTGVDPRQIGIRPTGVYWGGGGEQIDMQSGNLNYTLPVLQAKSRAGWGASFALNFNSQMWRKDLANNAIWYYGRDVGNGHGWRLLAGSILPVYSDYYTVAFYVYSDSTGAQYRLDINIGGVWTGKEGVYVHYDANTNKLYFNDGSFWVMGAESDGAEFDAGTRYPTLMQDTNGNQLS